MQDILYFTCVSISVLTLCAKYAAQINIAIFDNDHMLKKAHLSCDSWIQCEAWGDLSVS